MSDETSVRSRRDALKCLAFGGAGTLFTLAGGVFTPIELAVAAGDRQGAARLGKPLFVQISDTHIGFNKEANPDVNGTLARSIELVNGMPEQPALIIHTGDITHLSKPAEFDWRSSCSGNCVPPSCTRSRASTTLPTHRHGVLQSIWTELEQQGLLQLRSRWRALRGARERVAIQARRSRYPGRGATRLGGG